jgi:hypothetical protein
MDAAEEEEESLERREDFVAGGRSFIRIAA